MTYLSLVLIKCLDLNEYHQHHYKDLLKHPSSTADSSALTLKRPTHFRLHN